MTGRTAPGQSAMVSATRRIQSNPTPIGTKPADSRPNGINRIPNTAAGITSTPIKGTVSRLARSPNCAIWLKWAMAKGAVAAPATAEDRTTDATPCRTL